MNLRGLSLINAIDQWPSYLHDPVSYRKWMKNYYYFMIKGYPKPFGYVHRSIFHELQLPQRGWTIDEERRTLTMISSTFQQRTQIMRETLLLAVKDQARTSPRKFYEESLSLVSAEGEHVLDMDRCGLDPFGVISHSAHMIGFTEDESGVKYWVPKRSSTKPTVPNKLDSTIAGVLRSAEKPIECMVRKAAAEAFISEQYTRANIVSCGTFSYQMSITSSGLPGCQHIISYLYEMQFTNGVVPQPCHDEVGKFTLMTQEAVIAALMNGEFVANRAMIWLAYFIRHGILTPENDPDYKTICDKLHRKHDLFIAEDFTTS